MTDIRKSDSVFSDMEVEYFLVHPNRDHRWYYISEQMPSEAWLFLQADSRAKETCGKRRRFHDEMAAYNDFSAGVPHSSFMHPEMNASKVSRQSIELRLIAYYETEDSMLKM